MVESITSTEHWDLKKPKNHPQTGTEESEPYIKGFH